MGKLNLKLESAFSSKYLDKVTELGGKRMEEARINSFPLGYDGISLIDTLEAIDDDDKAAIEVARRESDDIAVAIENPTQFIEADSPPGQTMDDFTSDLLFSANFYNHQEMRNRRFKKLRRNVNQLFQNSTQRLTE